MVYLDGQRLAMLPQLASKDHHGWIGLGSSYDIVQFDQLMINRSTQLASFSTVTVAATE